MLTINSLIRSKINNNNYLRCECVRTHKNDPNIQCNTYMQVLILDIPFVYLFRVYSYTIQQFHVFYDVLHDCRITPMIRISQNSDRQIQQESKQKYLQRGAINTGIPLFRVFGRNKNESGNWQLATGNCLFIHSFVH